MSRDLSASPYLSQLAERYKPESPDALIAEAATADDLITLKQRFFLSWSLASLDGAEFSQLAAWQTEFAEVTLDRALRMAWEELHKEPLAGLFVLGLGKLGGRDLNLSSDVDLVAFYDSQTMPIPKHRGQSYEVHRVLKRMNTILQPRHSPDFVWRTDWRLRPEASVSNLAMEVEAARDFYFFRALPWHRLALIKARPVAGDFEAGKRFLDTLEPFLWRRNLDYRALDELASIKARINQEHPGLRAEREKPAPITDDPTGFNLKLGAGGIREIEFLANAAQLIWGGKQGELRTPNTLAALESLGSLGHYSQDDTTELCRIYTRLRRLENAVQMRLNEHTHSLPEDDALQAVKTLADDDLQGLEVDRRFVRERFDAVFRDEAAEPTQLPPYVRALNGEALAVAEMWQGGFGGYGVRDPGTLAGLAPELFWRIGASGLEPADAIARTHTFLASLSRSEQYLRLLAEHPQLLDPLLTPMLHSPHMASLLDMSPHIIDVFLSPEDDLDTDFVFASEDFETRLESLRRFVNERLYLNYYRLMTETLTPPEMQANLTAVAEAALYAALRIVADDLGIERLPLAVIGLGKIGTQELMPLSDLDLLFLFPDSTDSELAAKIVRRLRTVLTAKMGEGIVYELDMRLRPSGRSGPPAVKWTQFVEHHETRARNWEHLALSTARAVAGDRELGARAESFIADILARPRDREQLRADAARMCGRIYNQRLRDTPHRLFDARLREGGLLEAEFVGNTRRMLGENTDALSAPRRYFSDQLVWERLLGLTLKPDVPDRFADIVPMGRTGLMAVAVQSVTEATFAQTETDGEDLAVRWD